MNAWIPGNQERKGEAIPMGVLFFFYPFSFFLLYSFRFDTLPLPTLVYMPTSAFSLSI
jgi:hypothetical protein